MKTNLIYLSLKIKRVDFIDRLTIKHIPSGRNEYISQSGFNKNNLSENINFCYCHLGIFLSSKFLFFNKKCC